MSYICPLCEKPLSKWGTTINPSLFYWQCTNRECKGCWCAHYEDELKACPKNKRHKMKQLLLNKQ